MTKKAQQRGPYKKRLGLFALESLAEERADSPVFVTNEAGERQALEPWLKELRFDEALWLAEEILGETINQQEFQDCWARTNLPEKEPKSAEPPNTATFGGYRLKRRNALNRDKPNPYPSKKKRRW